MLKELSRRISSMKPSATIRMSAKIRSLAASGIQAIDFGVGEPNLDLPPNIKRAGIEAIHANRNRYTPVAGIKELKDAIAAKLLRDNDVEYAPEQVVVSSGAKQSLFNIISVLSNPGDEIILLRPFWVTYAEQVRLCGATPVFVDLDDDFHIKPGSVEKAISASTKAIILNTPSNPTGAVISKKDLLHIAALAKIHDFFIISDEVYEYFTFDGHEHVSVASLSKDAYDRTITVNACSKSHSMTGLRIGYCAGPRNIIKLVEDFQGQNSGNPSSIAQYMAVEALKATKDDFKPVVQEFDRKRRLAFELLLKAGVKCKKPEGAFYFFFPISMQSCSSPSHTAERLKFSGTWVQITHNIARKKKIACLRDCLLHTLFPTQISC